MSQVQFGARERGKQLHLADPKAVAERRRREMDWIYHDDVVAEHGLIE